MVKKSCFDRKILCLLALALVGLGFIFKDKLITAPTPSCNCDQ